MAASSSSEIQSPNNDIDNLQILFPQYTQNELETIYFTRGKDFKKTCEFLIQKKSPQTDRISKSRETAKSEDVTTKEQNMVIEKVLKMREHDHLAQKLSKQFGLNISMITWEDCARSKNSCWGPCICDMTLQVPSVMPYSFREKENRLPVIRYPNYQDLTWDVPMEKIFLMVGNETGEKELRRVSLKEYLDTVLTKRSLFCKEKDSHVLVSSQACMLPAAPGTEPKFNVTLYSYQSFSGDPAVLTIIASSQGSSAQTIGDKTEKLYFNKDGRKASFVGQRLKDNRKERGVALEGAMTKEEKEANLIMMIQVPLKQKERPFTRGFSYLMNVPLGGAMNDCLESASYGVPSSFGVSKNAKCGDTRQDSFEYHDEEAEDDVEDVIVKVSDEDEGPFPTVREKDLRRDTRFPIRVTLQFYKATSNGAMDRKTMEAIAHQFVEAQEDADFIGSIIIGRSLHRPTAHKDDVPYHINLPKWWNPYWSEVYSIYFQKFPEEMIRKSAEYVLLNSSRNFYKMSRSELDSMVFVQEVLTSTSSREA